ncbi:MAG: hypothetical protein WD069_17995 [Planctomycetales bacterium]
MGLDSRPRRRWGPALRGINPGASLVELFFVFAWARLELFLHVLGDLRGSELSASPPENVRTAESAEDAEVRSSTAAGISVEQKHAKGATG